MVAFRTFARCALLVCVSCMGLACGSGDDDEGPGAQSDAAGAPADAGRSDAGQPDAGKADGAVPDAGVVPGDHSVRCQAQAKTGMCLTFDDPLCEGRHYTACETRCVAMLDGFSDECGDCVSSTALLTIVFSGTDFACGGFPAVDFPFCAGECAGNQRPVEATDRIAKCDALCAPLGHDLECSFEVQAGCWQECRDRLEGLTHRCADCLIALSVPPLGPTQFDEKSCVRETWASIGECADYCR